MGTGIGQIASGVKNPEDLLIVTAGFAYKWSLLRLFPVAVIPKPISPAGMSQEEIIEATRISLQEATDLAYTLAA